ncbi:HlyD family secretion protein [Saccharospirillum mangrovi]|uniref:HlyD family secretion protein n=1 Tax=Saccharospirillum mangrovi TaxID=2161747 RepID=UPI000D3D4224|nr:HlyD family secretion protein [Saccharospirillum mangrovi]
MSEADTVSVRRRRPLVLASAGVVVVVGAGYWLFQQFTHVSVADARIAADMISVSSRVAGRVTALNAAQGERIAAGAVLATLDDRDSALNVAGLEAQLAGLQARREEMEARISLTDHQTQASLDAQRARIRAAQANLATARAHLAQAESDDERAERLAPQGVVTHESLDQARLALETARQQVQTAEADVESAQAALTQLTASREELTVLQRQLAELAPEENQLRIQRQRAELALDDHNVTMPVNGVIDQIFVDNAEFVSPGQRLVLVHDPARVRVDANVKETDIRYFTLGKAVQVTVDALPGRVFTGRVEAVGQAATSEFALLPSPNPSGNFTKVGQRLPVRIAIDQVDGLLKPGMMVEVEARTGG